MHYFDALGYRINYMGISILVAIFTNDQQWHLQSFLSSCKVVPQNEQPYYVIVPFTSVCQQPHYNGHLQNSSWNYGNAIRNFRGLKCNITHTRRKGGSLWHKAMTQIFLCGSLKLSFNFWALQHNSYMCKSCLILMICKKSVKKCFVIN